MENILIIGGSSGIGGALTSLLASQGIQVIATYNKSLVANQKNVSYHFLNVEEENPNLDFVPEKLDGLVYCPGTINLKPFIRFKPENFISDFQLQVVGAIKLIQKLIPNLKKSEHASIVLFSTVAVQQGFNFHSQVATSKGAIEGLTRALAAELAPKIRVNAIAPSITQTPLAKAILNTQDKVERNAERHPLKKIGEPINIAQTARFLLSSQSSWITGQIIPVDGGMSSIKN